MTLLRTIFRVCLFIFTVALAVYSLVELMRGMQPWLGWLGLTIAAVAPAAYFAYTGLRPKAGNDQLLLLVSALCGLGLAITMAVNWRYGEASGIIHLWAGICLIGWFVHLRWSRK